MTMSWVTGDPLADAGGGALFTAWLDAGAGEAAAGARRALDDASGGMPAPLFAGGDGAAWRAARAVAGADDGWEAARLDRLAGGACDVVVTGQQPGFLGGPLLVLHKVATAVALAEARCAAGLPTVAVFWCGDDDDDLVEALAPVGWDPVADGFVRAEGRVAARAGNLGRPRIGATRAGRWCAPGAALLRRCAEGSGAPPLAADLAALWEEALAADWTWSRLNVAALRRIFAGRPLAVVRGDDPDLHAAARPFYDLVAGRRERCIDLARTQGALLAAVAGRAPVSDRSLDRHLFVVRDDGRAALPLGEAPPSAAGLRPGVMLRSLAQDWLLRPVAVVVGPGEHAYLSQLAPLYGDLGVRRCALVPRLSGWVLPPGVAPGRVSALAKEAADDGVRTAGLADALAAQAAAAARDALVGGLGVAAARATALADGRARRWRRGVAAMLRDEARRRWLDAARGLPACVFPDGQRQERRLAAAAAAACWGDALATALIDAARDHVARGAAGDWREYVVQVGDDARTDGTERR